MPGGLPWEWRRAREPSGCAPWGSSHRLSGTDISTNDRAEALPLPRGPNAPIRGRRQSPRSARRASFPRLPRPARSPPWPRRASHPHRVVVARGASTIRRRSALDRPTRLPGKMDIRTVSPVREQSPEAVTTRPQLPRANLHRTENHAGSRSGNSPVWRVIHSSSISFSGSGISRAGPKGPCLSVEASFTRVYRREQCGSIRTDEASKKNGW